MSNYKILEVKILGMYVYVKLR